MSPLNHRGTVLPQNTGRDDDAAFQPGIAQPVSQAEIEDLLYADDRPVAERVERLREIRDELAMRESADLVGTDSDRVLGEIEEAIARLEGADPDAEGAYAELEGATMIDPNDHSETMSPDGDERAAREAEELDSLDEEVAEVHQADKDEEEDELDPVDRDDADSFRPQGGIHSV